ncbi:uncharacterized protein LOC142975831 [Anticarsia gemmatalis]|uniref:uncharacterized protein LOC142975831 n=1 Tax=Anticarsia gemmatalis TaxID=129554 RepID=UPI003F75C694
MTYTYPRSLFVLTLLQLCRAEISDNAPENWYSANVINDGFQPKSISEIFSTDSPFSSTNPIVVLPKSTSMPDKMLSSTLPPSTDLFSNTMSDFLKTSIIPLTSSTPLPPTMSTFPPETSPFASQFPSQQPQVEITQFTEQTPPPSTIFENRLRQTTLSSTELPTTLGQRTTLIQDPSPIGRFLVPVGNEPGLQSTPPPTLSTAAPPSSYFVIYDRSPQGFPSQGFFPQGGLFAPQQPQRPTTTTRLPGSTVVIQPVSTTPTPTPLMTSSSPRPCPRLTSRKPTTRLTTASLGSVTRPPTSRIPVFERTSTAFPINHSSTKFPNTGGLPVRIRVVGPRGSITHVNINPRIVAPTTTTRKPTTTRTRKTPKPKKNTYEACLGGCRVKREPICAIPISSTWIDPNQLKGFPSICHMACHNSYKKDVFEKLMDGRCGRLKTRIQTLDSKNKLKREELNKAQYVIDGGDQTIVEVSALRH